LWTSVKHLTSYRVCKCIDKLFVKLTTAGQRTTTGQNSCPEKLSLVFQKYGMTASQASPYLKPCDNTLPWLELIKNPCVKYQSSRQYKTSCHYAKYQQLTSWPVIVKQLPFHSLFSWIFVLDWLLLLLRVYKPDIQRRYD